MAAIGIFAATCHLTGICIIATYASKCSSAGRAISGYFPEQAVQWDWISSLIQKAKRPLKVLNLFGYTGLATLAAARAGASVTHVDASRKAVTWAHENQDLSDLSDRPIRWIVDDAVKFIHRQARREEKFDGLILDPPKVWPWTEG